QESKFERDVAAAAERSRRAAKEEKKKEEAKEWLSKLVGEHFQVRQKRRKLEVERLSTRVDEVRAAIKTRDEKQKDIIERRIDELIGEDAVGF
ncbi:MAG: hypothetical protein ACRDD1_14525, partial [Planctomycetia bacterium]